MQNKIPLTVPKVPETEEESVDQNKDESALPPDDPMKNFMREVTNIQKHIDEVVACNKRISDLAISHAKATLAGEEKKISDEMNSIITQGEKARDAIKSTLDRLAADIEAAAKKAEESKESQEPPELRMKRQIVGTLRAKFQELLQRTNEAQVEFKKAAQNKIKRQLKIGTTCRLIIVVSQARTDGGAAGGAVQGQRGGEPADQPDDAGGPRKGHRGCVRYQAKVRRRVETRAGIGGELCARIECGPGSPDVQGPRCARP